MNCYSGLARVCTAIVGLCCLFLQRLAHLETHTFGDRTGHPTAFAQVNITLCIQIDGVEIEVHQRLFVTDQNGAFQLQINAVTVFIPVGMSVTDSIAGRVAIAGNMGFFERIAGKQKPIQTFKNAAAIVRVGIDAAGTLVLSFYDNFSTGQEFLTVIGKVSLEIKQVQGFLCDKHTDQHVLLRCLSCVFFGQLAA